MSTLATARFTAPRPTPLEQARSTLKRLLVALAIWLVGYLILQGQDGFFAITVDRVDSLWLKLTVLNIPLQLVLMLGAGLCGQGLSVRAVRVGSALATLALLLAGAHVALSFATA